jgi:hypothetical protein
MHARGAHGDHKIAPMRLSPDQTHNAKARRSILWQAEAREVFDAWPNVSKDVNDSLEAGAS